MTQFEWGALITALVGFASWVLSLEVRLRNVQTKLIKSEIEKADLAATAKVQSLSDADLDAELARDLGPNKS